MEVIKGRRSNLSCWILGESGTVFNILWWEEVPSVAILALDCPISALNNQLSSTVDLFEGSSNFLYFTLKLRQTIF